MEGESETETGTETDPSPARDPAKLAAARESDVGTEKTTLRHRLLVIMIVAVRCRDR